MCSCEPLYAPTVRGPGESMAIWRLVPRRKFQYFEREFRVECSDKQTEKTPSKPEPEP